MAVSGGSTAPRMFGELATLDVPWRKVAIWQVDERVAPDGDPDRNANQLVTLAAKHHLMPVTARDLIASADRYARSLPDRFDVVHLGMGSDGHTASWPPGDPVIVSREPVALSGEYQGRVRMTLTPPVINRARGRVVLVLGADKADALARWLNPILGPVAGNRSTGSGVSMSSPPIARLRSTGTVIFCDQAAVGQ
jgi:6-phosphogluconolactonase/glucosamine-6-phosphate isomerase/deaminase